MLREVGVGKKLGVRQIISITVICTCLITLFVPWLYIGWHTERGNYDFDILDCFTVDDDDDYSFNDLFDLIRNNTDDLTDLTAKERNELRTIRKLISKAKKMSNDSKLTPVETATLCSYFAKILNSFTGEDIDYVKENRMIYTFGCIVLWILILIFTILGIRCIHAGLSGKRAPLVGITSCYLVLFLFYIAVSIYVNKLQNDNVPQTDSLSGLFAGIAISYMGIKDYSVFHIQFAPILGSILLIGNLIVDKMNLFSAATSEINVGIESVGKKVIWKCDCGSVNPSSSRFCAKCGKARPVDNTPLDFKTDVIGKVNWTCTCGNINPKKNAFCTKCGAMQPSETATAAYCKMCGRPVASGTELCKECLLKMGDTSRIRRAAPSERHTEETIADKKAGTTTDLSRVKKGFRPPTSLD